MKWTLDSLCESEATDDLHREIVTQLLKELGRAMTLPKQHKVSALELAHVLCEGNADLESALALVSGPPKQMQSQGWDPADIAVMQQRLEALRCSAPPASAVEDEPMDHETSLQSLKATHLVPGWRTVDSSWRPCPIGVFSAA